MGETLATENGLSKIKELVNSLETDKVARLVGMLIDELANKIEGCSHESRVLLDAIASGKQTLEEFLRSKEVVAAENAVAADQDIRKENDNSFASVDLTETLCISPSCENRKLIHTAETAAAVDEVPNISDDDHEGKLGFIFLDGYDTLFGTLRRESDCPEITYKLSVVPPKRRRGGAGEAMNFTLRIARKRDEFLKKTVEVANKLFINPATGQVNVSGGLIVGGSRIGFKFLRDMCFDPRIAAKIVYRLDVALKGGEEGLKELMKCWCASIAFEKNVVKLKSNYTYA